MTYEVIVETRVSGLLARQHYTMAAATGRDARQLALTAARLAGHDVTGRARTVRL